MRLIAVLGMSIRTLVKKNRTGKRTDVPLQPEALYYNTMASIHDDEINHVYCYL